MPSSMSCLYKNCRSSVHKNPGLKFVPFVKPKSDEKRALKWLKLIGKDNLTTNNIKYYTVLCEKHFPPNVDLNWRQNKALEPYPFSMEQVEAVIDCFDEDYIPQFKRPDKPLRTYTFRPGTKFQRNRFVFSIIRSLSTFKG